MIPFWQLSFLPAGSSLVSLHLLTTLAGLALAFRLFLRKAAIAGLPRGRAEEFCFFAIVPGLVGAHLGFLFLSGWPSGWNRLLNPMAGGVTMGGLLFGFLALVWRLRAWSATEAEWQRWFDTGARVFPWAWLVVRTGCFLAHDEPGIQTSFPLGVRYPDGTRHDLALYELLWAGALAAIPSQAPMQRFLVSYGVLRLGLHWLRPERHGLDLVLGGLLFLAGVTWPVLVRKLASQDEIEKG